MRSWKQKMRKTAAHWLALPPDALLDVSRVTCVDASEVIVENVVSLLRVAETEVEMDVGKYTLLLRGQGFVVTLVAQDEVHVTGEVSEFSYVRKGGGRT